MYKHFFGFQELPFKLVPSPDYLFLSRNHEEALAHLKYAALMGDGFAVITGEAGTGKTTLCRTFLEDLDHTVEAAYIFNPKLDPLALLKNINEEFGIPAADTAKELIDCLNRFLIEQNRAGKRVILVIDEAQNLATDVLEQLRLLSNLETTQSKLIQIILVGQPELGEMLDSYELRQLSQRVTLRCHLFPLSFLDTGRYIRHRIQVASSREGVPFTRAAIHRIHTYSQGIPRLVNIAADRALLTAFGREKRKITGAIARTAIQELLSHRDRRRPAAWGGILPWLAGGALLLAVFGTVRLLHLPSFSRPSDAEMRREAHLEDPKEAGPGQRYSPDTPAVYQVSPATAHADALPVDEKPVADPPEKVPAPASTELPGFLQRLRQDHSAAALSQAAAFTVIQRWLPEAKPAPMPPDPGDPSTLIALAAGKNGMLVHHLGADAISLLPKLNLPAVLEFPAPGNSSGGSVFLALTSVRDGKAVLQGGNPSQTAAFAWDDLQDIPGTRVYVLWKDYLGIPDTIRDSGDKEAVLLLKMHLYELGFTFIEMDPWYDEDTRRIVREIQARAGIPVDGRVGPLTKMVLCNQKQGLEIPRLGP